MLMLIFNFPYNPIRSRRCQDISSLHGKRLHSRKNAVDIHDIELITRIRTLCGQLTTCAYASHENVDSLKHFYHGILKTMMLLGLEAAEDRRDPFKLAHQIKQFEASLI
jgi:hypothetical protein